MWKKRLATLVAALFLLALPLAALAADKPVAITVFGFGRDAEEVEIIVDGVQAGDSYWIYLKDDTTLLLSSDTFKKDGKHKITIPKQGNPAFDGLRDGDKITIRINGAQKGDVKQTATELYDDSLAVPTKMSVRNGFLEAAKSGQRVAVVFDAPYKPGSGDRLALVPLNAKGEPMASSLVRTYPIEEASLKRAADGRLFEMTVDVPEGVTYYNLDFQSAGKRVDKLSARLTVAPSASEIKDFVVRYPESAAPGETVRPEAYFLAKDGRHFTVTGADYHFEGAAVAKSDRETGVFSVGEDKAYLGGVVKIDVKALNYVAHEEVAIAEKAKPAPAPEPSRTRVVMTIGAKTMQVNDGRVPLDAAPLIRDDRTFVPLRALAQAFGAEVHYDAKTRKITVRQADKRLEMTVGSKSYRADGVTGAMDVAPFIVKEAGRTMVPVRFASQALGYRVDVETKGGLTDRVIFTER